MGKYTLVMAIKDENYLFPLELALAEKVGENVDIEVISNPDYFETFFSYPRSIDLMIIDDFFEKADFKRHNIKKVFLLTEEVPDDDEPQAQRRITDTQQFARVFKYLTLSVLVSSIVPPEWGGANKLNAGTQIIAVISPEGGAGCSTVALGVAACLKQSLKRTLYIDTESLQSFHQHLSNCKEMTLDSCAKLRSPSPRIYQDIKAELQHEHFSYLPALPASRYALGITGAAYLQFVKAAQASGDFDMIVLDVGDELTPETIPLLDAASRILIVFRQGNDSAFKMRILMHNINCGDKDKFHFVCNRYQRNVLNAFVSEEFGNTIKIDEYIEEFPLESAFDIKTLAKNEGLQKVAYAMM